MTAWILNETSPEFGGGGPRAFASRTSAYAAARSVIEDYRNYSKVADQINDVLAELDEAFESDPDDFGAGDGGALFYVRVLLTEVEA